MAFKLKLKNFFIKESKTLIKSYKGLISKKKGVAMDRAPSNKPSTVKKKGKDHWLVDTGETKERGFAFQATDTKMRVFAPDEKHSGRSTYITRRGGQPTGKKIYKSMNPPTYLQLFAWHNTAGGRYSGVFQKVPVGSLLFDRLDTEIEKQFNSYIKNDFIKKFRRIR